MKYIDLPPVWTLGAWLAVWALGTYVPIWRFSVPGLVPDVIFVAAIALALWTVVTFFRARTPVEPRHTPKTLLTGGPFRLNRNPIYTALVLLVLQAALGQGALSAFVPVALLPWILTRRFILSEEAALRTAFGAEAEAWLARTRRW